MTSTKKISLKRFQDKSQQVFRLMNAQNIDIIIYDDKGPLAMITPFSNATQPGKLLTLEPQREYSSSPMDQGGVWALSDSVRKAIAPPPPEKNPSLFSLAGLRKAARVSVTIPFMSRS